MSVELTRGQLLATALGEAWFHSGTEQLFVIEGYPGTGKTFLVLHLIEQFGLDMDEVLFLTYMGKAANQLSKHGLPAKTIDSAIYDYSQVPMKDQYGNPIYTESGRVKKEWIKERKSHLKKGIKLIVIDEHRMVDIKRGEDIMSYGIPVIALGDKNQLDPPFGKPFIDRDPDVTLKEIMRQNQDSPIVYLSQKIIHREELKPGVYGNCAVIKRDMLEAYQLKNADIVITQTNKLRFRLNNMFRQYFKKYEELGRLHLGEKVICKRNNWKERVDKFYLTNGTVGTIYDIDNSSMDGKNLIIDFQADFLKHPYKKLKIDYQRLFQSPDEIQENGSSYIPGIDLFEFAYAITTYSSQGSEWDKVLCFDERIGDKEMQTKLLFTAVTRARESVTIVLP